jgi:hypothetical protein
VWQRFVGPDDWLVPGIFILASGAILLPGLLRCLRRSTQEVLADHLFMLVAAFMVYFVAGALLIPFGPREQTEYALSYYWIDAPLAMRATAANCIGLGLALFSASLVGQRWVSGLARAAVGLGQNIPQKWVMAAFLFLGGASSLYLLPFDTGLRPGEVAPGILRTMSSLLLVLIMVAAAYRGRWSAGSLLLAIALTLTEALVGLLLLIKSAVLLPMMALLAGLAWRLGIRRVVVPGVVALLAVFFLIGDATMAGRNFYGLEDWVEVDWSDRIAFLRNGLSGERDPRLGGQYQTWSRFCYLPAQGAAIDFYDADRGGEDHHLLGWAFLPRFLFPDKPALTASAAEFHTKITGAVGTFTGQGVFVNGYYNLGWWGVLAVGVAVGCMLTWTSAFAVEVFQSRALVWLPMALLGSFMAFRVDGTFLTDYWTMFVLFGYAAVAGATLAKLWRHGCRV